MNARQTFKQGFIRGCIDMGMTTPAQIRDFVKAAVDKLANQGGGLGSFVALDALGNAVKGVGTAVGDTIGTGLGWGIPIALAGPALLGAGAGTMAAKATDIGDNDVEDAKQQETVDEYQRQAARLRREGMLRRHLQTTAPRRW